MAKISSSQPPSRPRPSPDAAPSRASSGGRAPKASAAEAQRADKSSHDGSGTTGVEGEGGAPATLGEALGRERELRDDQRAFTLDSPWEDPNAEQEDKQRADELHKRERLQKKADGKAGGQDGRPQSQQAGRAAQQQRGGAAGQLAGQSLKGGSGFDGFEGLGKPAVKVKQANPALSAPPLGGMPIAPALPQRLGGGAIHVLNNAKDPGVYFQEEGHEDGGRPEEDEDPELADAVEETIRLLFGVRGIHRVGPGQNDAGEPVIVITTARGFSESSMKAVPAQVHRFRTLVALSYELLPLRRDPR